MGGGTPLTLGGRVICKFKANLCLLHDNFIPFAVYKDCDLNLSFKVIVNHDKEVFIYLFKQTNLVLT